MSAFVKSIRLRRVDDALMWFQAMWAFPSLRPRLTRRILISSAEDGFSHELVVRVARWYRGQHRFSEQHAAAEIVRICATPSWWELEDGHEYIFAWLVAERHASDVPGDSFAKLEMELEACVDSQALIRGIAIFVRMSLHPAFCNDRLTEQFGRWVDRCSAERTTLLYDEWRAVAPTLGRDGNIAGFLLYDLLGGRIPTAVVPEVFPSVQLTAQRHKWNGSDASIPAWANDGIHARAPGPVDKRFAGLVPNFAKMCLAHSTFGRLSPDDSWKDLPSI